MLKELIRANGASQRDVAEAVGMSPSGLNLLINRGLTPKRGWPETRAKLVNCLEGPKASRAAIEKALDNLERPAGLEPAAEKAAREDELMILKKQSLDMRTRQAFGLVRNPFDDPQQSDDVYLSPEIRYVREAMYDAAVNGGFLAVIGESGAGKSTLKDELIGRLEAENQPVVVIEPYTLAMAENEQKGNPLRSQHIAEAIISTLAPGRNIPSSPEMRFRRLHEVLKESAQAGHMHVVIFEEAHDMPWHTLKSLKRFWEMKAGLKRLLSIILIGQSELASKMQSAGASIREVVQRCNIVHLPPISDIGDFLAFRFKRSGADFHSAIAPDAVDALQQRLIIAPDQSGKGVSMLYPLAVSNLTIAALNLAAQVGEKQVTADVVRMVRP